MSQSVCRSAIVAGIVALLALCPPASVLAESTTAKPAHVSKPSLVPTVTREQALALLKRYFPVPDGPGKVEASLSSRGSRLFWQITYTVDRGFAGPPAAVGEIDAQSGQVRSFHTMGQERRPIRTGPLPAPRTEAEALSRAWLLVRELYPTEAATLRPAPQAPKASVFAPDGALADDYRFSWVQYHGEVPVADPVVTVSVDKNTLDYTELWASFPTLTFPAGAAKVTAAEALKLYRQALVPRLAYQPALDGSAMSDGVSAMKFVYRLERAGVVDAVSGRLVDASGQLIPALPQSEPVPPGTSPIVKVQQVPLNNDSAMALATELVGLPTGAQFDLGSGGQEELLDFFWDSADGSVSVSVDPTTGLIHNAYRYKNTPYPGNEDPEATVPLDAARQVEAKAVAIGLVQRYYSPLLADLRLETGSDAEGMGFGNGSSFFFQRYVNGIPAGQDGVAVSIDPNTTAWTDISMHWSTRVEFPNIDGVITVAEASDRFFAGHEPLLVYQPKAAPGSQAYGSLIPYMDEMAHPQATMLVYQMDTGAELLGYDMLDARTGQPVDWSARPRSAQADAAKELSGHWAEGELRYMLKQRALTPERLNPDAVLNRGEALQMLLTAQRSMFYSSGSRPASVSYADVKQGDSLYGMLRDGIRRGVLQPKGESAVFGAEQPITRAEFAVWLARTLKLDSLGRSGLVANSSFTDLTALSAEERNAAAFLQALGIAGGGEAFRGSAQLTQAEAAAFTVRLLNYLSASR